MEFVRIESTNDHFVDEISPGEYARGWVHFNRYWLARSEACSDVEARLIHVDASEAPVGFIAYGQHYADEELTQPVEGCGEVIHLVIERSKQRLGYGRSATVLAMDELGVDSRFRRIVIAHHPDNSGARALYESLGFVEVGRNHDGDPLLVIEVRPT